MDTSQSDSALEFRIRECVTSALQSEVVSFEWINAGIGLRRFARVGYSGGSGPESLIARVEAPEDPAGRPDGIQPEPLLEPIRACLEANGLPVPKRVGPSKSDDIELLEDLGDVALSNAARKASPAERRGLYERACALIPKLQRIERQPGVEAFDRNLDASLFRYKGNLFAEHSLPNPTAAQRDCIREGFERIAALSAEAPQRLAHRDFQSENLRLCEGRLVMIDLQGAFMAPPEYDLVCLLRDSYVELEASTIEALCEAIWPALPDAPDPELARLRFDALTLSRKGKDHARFLYAATTRNDPRFLEHVPTTVRHLRYAATRLARTEPAFGELCEIMHSLPEAPCAQ